MKYVKSLIILELWLVRSLDLLQLAEMGGKMLHQSSGGALYCTRWWLTRIIYRVRCVFWSQEVRSAKVSSLQGIVSLPIGWSNPNSSSAFLSRSWNNGRLKNDIGTTYLFFWLSPTYTAKYPFGTSADFEVANSFACRKICIDCSTRGTLKAIESLDGYVLFFSFLFI